MFCDACGATLQAGQQFCTRCGKGVIGPVAAGGGRVARHAHLLGILWIAYSVFILIAACVLFILANTLFPHLRELGRPGAPMPPMFLHPLFSFLSVLLGVKGALGVAAGVGLYQREQWARLLAIVLGIIGLLSMPFGTALGIYTLWVLLSPGADREYAAMAEA